MLWRWPIGPKAPFNPRVHPCFCMCVLMIYTHVLLSMCSGPFVCFWIERWPLYCIISLATTLQFPISSCFCVIVANIDFGEGPSLFQHQRGQWLSNVPIKKNNAVFHGRALGVAAGESAVKKKMAAPVTGQDRLAILALQGPKDKVKPLLLLWWWSLFFSCLSRLYFSGSCCNSCSHNAQLWRYICWRSNPSSQKTYALRGINSDRDAGK